MLIDIKIFVYNGLFLMAFWYLVFNCCMCSLLCISGVQTEMFIIILNWHCFFTVISSIIHSKQKIKIRKHLISRIYYDKNILIQGNFFLDHSMNFFLHAQNQCSSSQKGNLLNSESALLPKLSKKHYFF